MEEQQQLNMLRHDRSTMNQLVIEEFRTHGGKVGGVWEGMPMLLLTTIGARSGQKRITPLNFLLEDERLFVFASNSGAPTNPDWYHNLRKTPTVMVEVGTEHFQATAAVLEGEERNQISMRYMAYLSTRIKLEGKLTKLTREVPVIELVRSNAACQDRR